MSWLRRRGKAGPVRGEPAGNPLVWGRRYRGPHPAWLGALVVVLAVIGAYLAFAKELPWADEGYELRATFENAATLRESAPVRIAGVNVGEVTEVELDGELAKVTFTVSEEGRPVRADAEVEIRPRLFLEGNFFLDLRPGSANAPELESGDVIPATQTSTAVQLDEVLAALDEPSRRGLQRLLEGFGTALTYEPTAADDATQDPDVRGETAAQSLNDAFRYGGPAGRDTAIVADALRGEHPGDLTRLIRNAGGVFAKLDDREGELADLVSNLNVTAGAFAAEATNLGRSIELLGPTLTEARGSLRSLSDALPPLRALAVEARPGIQELPATIRAFEPWLRQADLLLGDRELGATARLVRRAAPGLARTAAGARRLFPQMRLAGLCTTQNLIPAADTAITTDAGGWNTGQPNFQELFYSVVQLAGAAQPFDGNGSYLRLQPGGGPQLLFNDNTGGGFENTRNFGTAIEAPAGIQPVLPDAPPPVRMDVPCHRNDPPSINGPASAAGPPDLEAAP
ncbi:MAG TPA: MlaD family protein [Solirubrobacterales bacterium]|jgi:ABC-type transporter Mla subunit MlaD